MLCLFANVSKQVVRRNEIENLMSFLHLLMLSSFFVGFPFSLDALVMGSLTFETTQTRGGKEPVEYFLSPV